MSKYRSLSKDELDEVLSKTSPHSFKFNVARMHEILRLPANDSPTLDPELIGESPVSRLTKFKRTLLDEVNEVDDIIAKFQDPLRSDKEVLVDIADWLSDIIVYCRSEAMKFGLPLEDTLEAVMGSNFSKVGDVPQYNEDGKVMKDLTRFVPPEDAINTILFGVARPRNPYSNIGEE